MLVNIFAPAAGQLLRAPGQTLQVAAYNLDKLAKRLAEARVIGKTNVALPAGAVDAVLGICLALGPVAAEAHVRADRIAEILGDRRAADDMRASEVHAKCDDAEALITTAAEIIEAADPANPTLDGVRRRLAMISAS